MFRPLLILTAAAVLAPITVRAASTQSSSTVTVFQPVQIASVSNLSTGFVKSQGSNASGTVIMPATFPLFATPAPSYQNFASAKNGANSDPGTAAKVNLTGQPNAPFQLVLSGWTHISGDTPISVAAPTYYSPSGTPTNSAKGVFNAQGRATIYIGATVTIPRDNNGTTLLEKPVFTIVYN